MTITSGQIIGTYKLRNFIGKGGFGEVWIGRHDLARTLYRAVKLVPKDRMGEVEVEGIRLYMSVAREQPCLVPIHELAVDANCYYYTMPLADDVNGDAVVRPPDQYSPLTLKRYLELHRPLPAGQVLAIAGRLLLALRALHNVGLVHRDLKPANVICLRGMWKLADMGLLTRSDLLDGAGGTPWFKPPEGARDRTADLYNLGKTLFLLATTLAPCHFESFIDGDLEIPGTDRRRGRLKKIIQKACKVDPLKRFQSADEMYKAVRKGIRFRTVTIVLDEDLADFIENNRLAEFLRELRGQGYGDFTVTDVESGSVRITLELPGDEAKQLVKAVRSGKFANFHATQAKLKLRLRELSLVGALERPAPWNEDFLRWEYPTSDTAEPAASGERTTIPQPPSAEALAVRAAACNNRVRYPHQTPPPIQLRKNGMKRLARLAVHFQRLLTVHACLSQWDKVLSLLGLLALEIRDGVFRARGADTAALLILSLMGDMRFRLQARVTLREMLSRLVEDIQDGDEARVTQYLRVCYANPH